MPKNDMAILKPLLTLINHPQNKGRLWRTLAVIVWWKVNQVFFHQPSIVEIAPGVRIICRPDNSYGSFIVYATYPEYEELQFIKNFLQTDDTFIDVGAHIGDSSLLASTKIKTGKILAFEPTPKIFAELMENIRLNTLETRITAVQEALADKQGMARFALESEAEVNHLQIGRGGKTIEVKTTTIDAAVKKYKLNKISLLKIDVEGFEWEVLKGAKKSLDSGLVDGIIFEVNPLSEGIAQKVKDIESLLESHGFGFYAFRCDGKLEPVSNIGVPAKTSNFLAVSSDPKIVRRIRKWKK